MTQPRKVLISIEDTPYYHIVSRCVRRAWLCGKDPLTGNCYEHRREWVENRLRLLSSLFAIDIAAYAVMSNHYHLVLKLDPDQSKDWSHRETISRTYTSYNLGCEMEEREHRLIKKLVSKISPMVDIRKMGREDLDARF